MKYTQEQLDKMFATGMHLLNDELTELGATRLLRIANILRKCESPSDLMMTILQCEGLAIFMINCTLSIIATWMKTNVKNMPPRGGVDDLR